jgi:hypothetical protein
MPQLEDLYGLADVAARKESEPAQDATQSQVGKPNSRIGDLARYWLRFVNPKVTLCRLSSAAVHLATPVPPGGEQAWRGSRSCRCEASGRRLGGACSSGSEDQARQLWRRTIFNESADGHHVRVIRPFLRKGVGSAGSRLLRWSRGGPAVRGRLALAENYRCIQCNHALYDPGRAVSIGAWRRQSGRPRPGCWQRWKPSVALMPKMV